METLVRLQLQLELVSMNASVGQVDVAEPYLTLKLNNFHERRTDTIYSPPFYTRYGGYKMCIRVDSNGWGEGKSTHVSVYAYLMRGENDDHLP